MSCAADVHIGDDAGCSAHPEEAVADQAGAVVTLVVVDGLHCHASIRQLVFLSVFKQFWLIQAYRAQLLGLTWRLGFQAA